MPKVKDKEVAKKYMQDEKVEKDMLDWIGKMPYPEDKKKRICKAYAEARNESKEENENSFTQ